MDSGNKGDGGDGGGATEGGGNEGSGHGYSLLDSQAVAPRREAQ